ncbi:MAG: DUF4434 domain-containing protein [Acidobacteria bacterium]|nr:DUF4434 domain-containing protein [Acidobacteriota bacterium]MBA3884209.1 DUF4434 domain-containing protein [Acidobacteriota bacterium]
MGGKFLMAFLALSIGGVALAPPCAEAAPDGIAVTASHRRAQPGDRIEVTFAGTGEIRAVLVVPGGGTRDLTVERRASGGARTLLDLPQDAAEGLYIVHAWRGPRAAPAAVGKRSFLVGRIVVDFFISRYLDSRDPAGDLGAYLDDFAGVGGNAVIAHALITPEQAYFPSRIARTPITPGSPDDAVEALLAQANRRGLAVFLSVSWDMTRRTPYKGRMAEITALIDELYGLYAHHPSLAGFYSYQEGSGTYYVPYVREFTAHVKHVHDGLLTSVAPFLDDPLLAGYLSTVDTLDIVIYQGMVMASYRTDNRKLFPIRRVRDFAALGIGAKWLQDKFAVVHVELFAYLEKRRAPGVLAAAYEDIYRQILSVATAAGSDGIALFAYGPHIHAARAEPLVQPSREAVRDGLAMFGLVTGDISAQPYPLAVYIPYSDWIVERWTQNLVPAFDAFRRAGVAVDVLPYAPAIEESHYPYFPFHMNPDVLDQLLRTRRVLVLTDISGFQQTDSDLIDAFLKKGGTVVALGPQIPMGRTFDRDEVFGGREMGTASRTSIRARERISRRVEPGTTRRFSEHVTLPLWEATSGRVLAAFEDGTPAALANRYGEGLAISVLAPASRLALDFPELLRDVFDLALDHAGHPPLPDIAGLTEESDIAVRRTPDGVGIAIVNHAAQPQRVEISAPAGRGAWTDAAGGADLPVDAHGRLTTTVPPHGIRVLRFREEVSPAAGEHPQAQKRPRP